MASLPSLKQRQFFHACRTPSRRHRHNRNRRRRLFLLEPAAVPGRCPPVWRRPMAGSRSSGWISPPSWRAASPRSASGKVTRCGPAISSRAWTSPNCRPNCSRRKPTIRRAIEATGKAEAEVAIREAEQQLSEVELRRVVELERRAAVSTAEVDRRRAENEVAKAEILGAKATVRDAQSRPRGRRSARQPISKPPSPT